MGSPRMGAHRAMVIDGGEQIKSQVRSGPSQICMYCTMYDPIPFQLQDGACEPASGRERVSAVSVLSARVGL